MHYDELQRYLLLQDLIGRQMRLLILRYIVLQQKDMESAVKLIASHLKVLTFSGILLLVETLLLVA